MRRALAYVRVSRDGERPENQVEAIKRWAKEHDIEVVGFYIDIDVSGGVPPRDRPNYRVMLDTAKKLGIKLLLFYDLSRLSRSLEEGLLELKRLTEEGFSYKFVAQEFLDYIEDPMLRKKVISDFLWFAELYREDIRRRTKEALERLRREGKRLGRPPVEIPLDLVRKYLSKGLSKKDAYRLLVSQGYLKYKEKGEEKVLSYDRFLKRLKKLGL